MRTYHLRRGWHSVSDVLIKKGNESMNIAIVGSGYVGLVTGVCLAHIGHNVTCVDNNEEKIKKLRKAQVPIYEPGLDELIKKYIKSKRDRKSVV